MRSKIVMRSRLADEEQSRMIFVLWRHFHSLIEEMNIVLCDGPSFFVYCVWRPLLRTIETGISQPGVIHGARNTVIPLIE
jgi:hypothetical protein